MVEETKYCSCMMTDHFNEELVMIKEVHQNFESSTKCWSCNNSFAEDVKVRDNCHITGKYRSAANRYCNITISLN